MNTASIILLPLPLNQALGLQAIQDPDNRAGAQMDP
jgi:hypothetical protein